MIQTLLSLLLAVSPAGAAVKNPNTFVYAVVGDVTTLDPHWQYDGISSFVAEQIYEGLVGFEGSRTDTVVPLLASKVPTRANGLISNDRRSYTFPIRKGVTFHDGSALTAEDVRYSLLRSMLQDRAGGHAWLLLDPILGVSSSRKDGKLIADLYTRAAKAVRVKGNSVVIRLHKPFAPFMSVLPNYALIVAKKSSDWDGSAASWKKHNNASKEDSAYFKRSNGTGPFKVERWDQKNHTLYLSRHEKYWRGPAKLKRLVVKTVDEFGTRRLLLQGGDADAIFVDRNYLPQVASVPGVTVRDGLPFLETHNTITFGFEVETKGNRLVGSGRLDGRGIPGDFFKDKDARLGFAYAFPYRQYLEQVYRGAGSQARGAIPRGVLGYDANTPVFKQDLAKAEAHFKKAFGGKLWGKGFRLTCVFQQGKDTRGQACRILGGVLRQLNSKFIVETRGIQWSSLLDLYTKRMLPLECGRWGLDYPDPHNPVYAYLHSEGYYAKTQGYANPKMDALIEAAVIETNVAKRKTLYSKIQRLAHEDVSVLYTIDTHDFRVVRDWVKDFDHNPIVPYGYFHKVYKE
ncbi:MAG: peptide ABC transporter substrate-binding protein [Elusimicrobia bacterium]|nr:MAG: peptide ABC transporter substrate-binding protein [Elusimicrobiota bacterium]